MIQPIHTLHATRHNSSILFYATVECLMYSVLHNGRCVSNVYKIDPYISYTDNYDIHTVSSISISIPLIYNNIESDNVTDVQAIRVYAGRLCIMGLGATLFIVHG